MNKLNTVIQLLKQENISLVLTEVGASGETWDIFELLKPIADLLRFDPDLRDIRETAEIKPRRVVTLNRAVVDNEIEEVTFYLTKSPYCSSTLKPDFARLKNFPYADWFEIEKTVQVPAINLDRAIVLAKFDRIDWIKLDTQGTEFRILNSISQNIFDRVLVCDLEASLYPHYIDADTLPSMHELMLNNDFWIVEMRPHWNTRISANLMTKLTQRYQGQNNKIFKYSKHKEVTTLEFCYLRTIEGAKKRTYNLEDFLRLFLCHYSLGVFEYCLEILDSTEHLFGKSELVNALRQETLKAMDVRVLKSKLPYYIEALVFRLRRLFPSMLWQY
jgi:FkbM family methyltransferase